jgi:flagellar biosynthesis/type III secretory pathway chaperone
MTKSVKYLIEALRSELENYGEMLALLDRQQEFLIARAASELFQSINSIKTQGVAISQARSHREACRRTVADEYRLPEQAGFPALIPLLPPDYQPLLKALVHENNELLKRVRQRARQNHLMLRRSVALMQELLDSLLPSRQPAACPAAASRPKAARDRRLLQALR